MALPLVVDAIDSVAEVFRGEYTEKDGKFHLNVEGMEDVGGLKTALNSERQLRAKHEKAVKAWEKLGKTPDEISDLLAEQARKDEEHARKSGDFDSILKQHQSNWDKERGELTAERDASRASERDAIVGERLLGALTKAGVTEEGAELLPEKLSGRIELETVNGKRVLRIMQADGDTPMAGTGADGMATLDDLVKEASTKYLSLFKSNSGGGGGKPPNENGGGKPPTNGPKSLAECKTDAERVAYLQAQRAAKAAKAS